MKAVAICALTIALAGAAACGEKDRLEIPEGSDVTLQKRDGVVVTGRLVEVKPERVVVELRDGKRTEVPRAEISSLKTAAVSAPQGATAKTDGAGSNSTASSARGSSGHAANGDGTKAKAEDDAMSTAGMYREVTIPAGTVLPLELKSSVASDTSKVEDQVRAALRRSVQIDGVAALPAGTVALGHVTNAERSARVKGLASIAFRFTKLDLPGDGERLSIRTNVFSRQAAATKKKDAAKIGAGAAGGAIVGGILGGGDGAAKGAAVGGAAGTGVVLSTRGKEVRLGPGADVSVRLAAPLTVRVPVR